MAYDTSNPPECILPSSDGSKSAIWVYKSTDTHTDVDAASYFSNGVMLGMKVGDIVYVIDTDTGYVATLHAVASVSGIAATISAAVLV